MDATKPEFVSRLLVSFLQKGDLDGLMDLYEAEAVFVDLDGVAAGSDAIRAAHQAFLDSGLRLVLNDSVVFEMNDIALVQWSWTVERPDGVSADGSSAEVLRRQSDGTWKFIIDNSDGPAVIGNV